MKIPPSVQTLRTSGSMSASRTWLWLTFANSNAPWENSAWTRTHSCIALLRSSQQRPISWQTLSCSLIPEGVKRRNLMRSDAFISWTTNSYGQSIRDSARHVSTGKGVHQAISGPYQYLFSYRIDRMASWRRFSSGDRSTFPSTPRVGTMTNPKASDKRHSSWSILASPSPACTARWTTGFCWRRA